MGLMGARVATLNVGCLYDGEGIDECVTKLDFCFVVARRCRQSRRFLMLTAAAVVYPKTCLD